MATNHARLRGIVSERNRRAAEALESFEHFTDRGTPDQRLARLAAFAAKTLSAQACSITLLEGNDARDTTSWRQIRFPALPEPGAHGTQTEEAIHRRVIETGKPLLRKKIDSAAPDTECSALARASMICTPLSIDGQTIGAIQVTQPAYKSSFDLRDLDRLEIVALFVGKAIQVVQLQRVLQSRFTQLALAHETKAAPERRLHSWHPSQGQMAKILAKTFYREMAGAGFDCRQIIAAATAIIAELTRSLAGPTALDPG